MKKVISFLLLYIFCSFTCNTTEPPPPDNRKITLTFEDVSCTEAWIQLTTENLTLPLTINVLQNDTLSHVSILTTQDSLLLIDSLLPNKTYTFQATLSGIGNPASGISSNLITATTMDTTSHNFTFETWTFGDVGSSVLYDVAIIDENNIWAVGEINIADTSENGYTTFNAIHWNGNEWELKRVFFPTVCGSTNLYSYPAKAIFVFENGNIWISSSGDKIAILKNGIQTDKFCLPSNVSMSINKIWGTSNDDLYVVGNGGSIALYQNGQWSKIESGTSLNINDIWGDYNEKTNEWEILVVGGNILQGGESERLIFKINENQAQQLNAEGTNWPLRTIWFKSSRRYYTAGSGIYEKTNINQNYWENSVYDITTYSINNLRGEYLNNIAATGGLGELVYFNGFNWRSYFEETMLQGNFRGLTIKDVLVIAVGQNSSQAVITIGRRSN